MKIIIIGGGQVGSYVAKLMLKAGNQVKIIEQRERVIRFVEGEFPANVLVTGDGADPNILEKAGITDADVVAVVTGQDEINLVAATIAKFEFGVERVIARVNNPKNEWLFTAEMGVDVKISQASLLARIIADQIDMENIVTLMQLNHGDNSIVEITVNHGAEAENLPLKKIPIPQQTVIVAIQRQDENIPARGETILRAGDHLIAYTPTSEEAALHRLMR
ncbi:potassium channel family protein [Enterococcus nangangensis]|uniref:potassium channel family protein n=1 Tax=Enterococcus nangangensis TaxID=2559926 RepID=UPI0010F87086|nr:TrkA family potassium uptake protein [Enterococcus nangangensis]